MERKTKRIAGMFAVLCCAMAPLQASGQILSDAAGVIDLRLNPFFDTKIVWSEELGHNINVPDDGLHEVVPVSLSDVSASLDGTSSFSSDGLSEIEYHYESNSPGEARFNILAYADTLRPPDGSGGTAQIELDFTVSAPIRYRFEAEAIDIPFGYAVSFNGKVGDASYNNGYFDGTFPVHYFYEDGVPVYAFGWDTYIDEGILPAGTYQLSALARSGVYQTSPGLDSRGTASLHIQLLGDADLDGHVGIDDLNLVLGRWNDNIPAGDTYLGDLNGDGLIDIIDLNEVLSSWNADVRPAQAAVAAITIPEPVSVSMVLSLSLALLGRNVSRQQH